MLPNRFGELINLQHIDLNDAASLQMLPDRFGELINLQHIDLNDATSLHMLPSSFGNLNQLKYISLNGAPSLQMLPDCFVELTNLQHIDLDGAVSLQMLPNSFGNLNQLKYISLEDASSFQMLPNSFGNLTGLRHLSLGGCENLTVSNRTLGNITMLEFLNLSNCKQMKELPPQVANQLPLQGLYLSGTMLKEIPRDMGVPFEFGVIHQHHLHKLNVSTLKIRPDEALAINCIHSLQRVAKNGRDYILSTFYSMNPKIVTVVEDEVDLTPEDFGACFSECLRFFSLFFDSLEESFSRTSNERLMLERTSARSMVSILACEDSEFYERREKGAQWAWRLKEAGFIHAAFSDDVVDDVRALLKRYKEGWGHCSNSDGLFLT